MNLAFRINESLYNAKRFSINIMGSLQMDYATCEKYLNEKSYKLDIELCVMKLVLHSSMNDLYFLCMEYFKRGVKRASYGFGGFKQPTHSPSLKPTLYI